MTPCAMNESKRCFGLVDCFLRRYFPERIQARLAGRFRDADLHQLGLLNKENQQKSELDAMRDTNQDQMRQIAQTGGVSSTTQRSRQLMNEYLATSADIERREVELKRTSNQRTQNEIQIQQFHIAVEKDQTKDNPISRLYDMVPSVEVMIRRHEGVVQFNDNVVEMTKVLDDQDAELSGGSGASTVDSNAMLALTEFMQQYETEQEKLTDAVLLDCSKPQSDKSQSMASKVKQSFKFARLVENDIDTS